MWNRCALLLICAFLCFSATVSARAQSESCLDSKKVDYFFKEFEITKRSDQTNVDLCDSKSVAHTLIRGLIFLKELGELDSERTLLNNNWIVGSPYDFFRSRVKKIVLDDNADCVGLSQIWPSERTDKVIRLCTKATQYDTLILTEALVHEARHLETTEHAHAICRDGEMQGREACDPSYESGGAYAVGVEYLIKIHQTARLDSALREQAHQLAIKSLRQRFNVVPYGLAQFAARTEADEVRSPLFR